MRIDILTLFPAMFDGFLNESIIKRSINDKKVIINIHNIRDYSKDKHKKVDDYAFGGGKGMVLMPQPIFDAVESIKTIDSKIILLTPQGVKYNQTLAYDLSKEKHLILICGHYEGFDERIRILADMEISIGDYVLTGGEIPSMAITDSVVRLLDGVIQEESHLNDSFNNDLLDYPVYTKPVDFRGMKVPDVLLSGHHANINKWRYDEQVKRTKLRRPDLLERDDVMSKGYYISRQPNTGEIVYINYDNVKGYNIAPKNNVKYDGIRVNKMIIVKPSMIEKVLKRKIKNRLDLYLKTILELMEESSEGDSSGIREALNDLTRFKNIVRFKYQKYLDEKYVTLLNKKIEVLEYELKKKLMVREEKQLYNNMYDTYMNNMYVGNYENVDEMTSHRRR